MRGSAFHIPLFVKGTTSLILSAALCLGACGDPGPLDVEVIVGDGWVVAYVKDRGLECTCSGEVLDEGQCTTYSDIGVECECEGEPSGCEIEARLLDGDAELVALDPVAVPARRLLSAGGTASGGDLSLELSGCGAHAVIDLPRALDVTASFSVAGSGSAATLEWSTDTPVDRIHVECGGPFSGHVCGDAAVSPASMSSALCDPLDAGVHWSVRLFDYERSVESDIGRVEVWRTASAEWNRE